MGLLCFLGASIALIAISAYRRKHPEFAAYEKPLPAEGAPAETTEQPEGSTEPATETAETKEQPEGSTEPATETPADEEPPAEEPAEKPAAKPAKRPSPTARGKILLVTPKKSRRKTLSRSRGKKNEDH